MLATLVFGGGAALASLLRGRGLLWTWAMLGVPLGLLLWDHSLMVGLVVGFGCLRAAMLGARWHRADVHSGADLAAAARSRLPVLETLTRLARERLGQPRGGLASGLTARAASPAATRPSCHPSEIKRLPNGSAAVIAAAVRRRRSPVSTTPRRPHGGATASLRRR